MARQAGIRWLKQMFSWEQIEPRKGQFWDERYKKSTWEKYDDLVNLSRKHGLRVIARVDRAPDWARRSNISPTALPDNLEDYGNFIHTLVSRYKGKIQHYQIWNEPNLTGEWGGRPIDAARYVELLKVAYRRAKEADPNAVILSAPLAQTLEKSERNLNELDFLKAMYVSGAKDSFDILFANAYGFDKPPADPPNAHVLNFQRVRLLRDIMVQNGDGDKAVWLNEFGWNAAPADFPPDKLYWGRVSDQQQAEYTASALRIAHSWDWLGVINLWFFRQVGDMSPKDSAEYYFRVVDTDFTPRPVYFKVKELSKEYEVAGPGTYQETSGAVETNGSWTYEGAASAWGEALLTSSQVGDSVTLRFKGTKVELIFQGDETSGMAYVSVDGKSTPVLPQSEQGKSYVDLYRPDLTPEASAVIVKGLPPGQHTVQLTVAGEHNPASKGNKVTVDGFSVESEPGSAGAFYGYVGGAVIGGIGLAATLLRRRRR